MNLISRLRSKLQVVTLRSELKKAKASDAQKSWEATGEGVLKNIGESGKAFCTGTEAIAGMRVALKGLSELGVAPSMDSTPGCHSVDGDLWLAVKRGDLPKTAVGEAGKHGVIAAYNELAAAIASQAAPNPSSEKPVKSPAVTSPVAPEAAKPVQAGIPASVARPKAKLPEAVKPVPSPFAKKPDFSGLRGSERVAAAIKWDSNRKAYFHNEAERQVAAEEAAAVVDPTAGKPVTAASIAAEIIRQQEEARKAQGGALASQAFNRAARVKKLAAELMAKDPK